MLFDLLSRIAELARISVVFYLLAGLPMTMAAYLLHHKNPVAPLSFRRFRRFVLPVHILRHPSSLLDYRFAVVELLFFSVLYGVVRQLVPGVMSTTTLTLAAAFGPSDRSPGDTAFGSIVLFAVVSFVALDLLRYLLHRMAHAVPVLWEFHKVHHSAEVLNPITAYRAHPFPELYSALLQTLLVDVVAGVFDYRYPGIVSHTAVIQVNITIIVTFVLSSYLQHSGVWLHFGPHLNRVFNTPAHHQIHHSLRPEHLSRNYGTTLACWDWMFGTLYVPADLERFPVGLADGEEQAQFRTVKQLYLTPFVRIWNHHLRPLLVGGEPARNQGSPRTHWRNT